MLIGREADLERITRAVLDHRLVILHGYSGSGKSSLLQNGLLHRLAESEFAVLVGREWSSPPEELGHTDREDWIERYIAGGVKRSHEDADAPIPVPAGIDVAALAEIGGLTRETDERFGEAAVIILDQFEELLRQRKRESAKAIVEWIVKCGYRRETHFVISLRTDSLHLLDPLLRGVKPFSMDRVGVGELVDPEAIREVIQTPARPSESGMTDEAVSRLMELWGVHRPKLLELQATLYTLYFRAKGRSERGGHGVVEIDGKAVLALVSGASEGESPFEFGLRDAIRLKIGHAEEACRLGEGLDEYLISGTREVVKRLAPLLSSGDYKVPVQGVELARRALTREMQVLGRAVAAEAGVRPHRLAARATDDVLEKLFDRLESVDFLTARVEDVLESSSGSAGYVDVTAGPMMASSATETLFEEVRRAAFAIEWLLQTKIVRKEPDGTLLLIHDGSGNALRSWADADDTAPFHALRQLTGARGEHYVWENVEIGGADRTVHANLNWRDCRISARFLNVVFVNCDFRGSRFESCAFQGVTFVNCLLDDANFEYCEISLPPNLPLVTRAVEEGGEATRVAPSFLVDTTREEVRAFSPYPPYPVLGAEEAPQFFSDTSGTPGTPGVAPASHDGEIVAFTPASGGVAMVGGRLCMLTIYRCRAANDGSFAFHHVAGEGLVIVDQDGGSVEIHDAAIRGITFSRDEDNPNLAGRRWRTHPIHVAVSDSMITNVYFADKVSGGAEFVGSLVLMLMNASTRSGSNGFRVEITNCRYQFLANTQEPVGSPEDSKLDEVRYFEPINGTDSRFVTRNRGHLARDLEAMDYQARPDESEQQRRARKAGTPSRGR
jgi:hypothetical protein